MSRTAPLLVLLAAAGLLAPAASPSPRGAPSKKFTRDFPIDRCLFATTAQNDFFPLEPGRTWTLESAAGRPVERLEIAVQDELRTIGGVACRVVEETTTFDGELRDVTRACYAIDCGTRNVYLFAESVDEYRDGVIVGHDGTWEAFVDGALPGLKMPGTLLLGARFVHATAPGVGEERSELVALDDKVKTPAGAFRGCAKFEETSAHEPDESTVKAYAPGTGLVKDGALELIATGR
jgi:hypothetical protein